MRYYAIQDKFESKFERITETGCWLWTDAPDKDGYGELKFQYKKDRAHRISWEIYRGDIPDGLCVLHSCDVPSCVNPNHLFLGTLIDNNADKQNKNRQAKGSTSGAKLHPECIVRGINHGLAKLTDEQVKAIRADTRSQRKIATAYGLSQPTIGSIIRKETWKHVK